MILRNKLVCLLLLSAGAAATTMLAEGRATAAGVRFDRVGPFGGSVRSLTLSRHDPQVCYLGTTDGQILKSVDGGISWKPLYPGIGRRSLVVDTLVEHPRERDRLFAGAWDLRSEGGGLFESRDGGRNWTQIALPKPSAAVRGMAISRHNPDRMIVGALTGVYLSDDGGGSWREVPILPEGIQNVESVAIDSEKGEVLFVGTWRLGYRSPDFGRTWKRNNRGMMLDSDVFSIAMSELDPDTVYAGACTGVYRSGDGGESWSRLKVLSHTYVIRTHVVCPDPVQRQRVYAGTTEGLYVSENGGRTWRRLTSGDLTINAIQIDPGNGSRILVGTNEEGVLRSEDGGKTWRASNSGFAARRISRILPLAEDDGRRLTGLLSDGSNGGFYQFDPDRAEWAPIASRIRPEEVLALLSLPGGSGRLIGTPQGVYLEKPAGGKWTKLPGIIGRYSVQDMVYDSENRWIYAGTSNGIYRARPDELQFQKPAGYRLLPRVSALVLSTTLPRIIYAATHLGLLRSRDQGATWDVISAGLPDASVDVMSVSPADPDHVFAGTAVGLYESRDGGRSWRRVPDNRLAGHIPAVVFLDASGSRILAADAGSSSLLLSEDGGSSWSSLELSEYGSPIRCVAKDPTRPGSIFIGTHSEGIYRLQLLQTSMGRSIR